MQSEKTSGLTPIEFLKLFNQMTQDFQITESSLRFVRPEDSSKLTLFKKFPIPNYYANMEGLNIEIKDEIKNQRIALNKFNKKDEEFRSKHNRLMRNIVNDMIDNNERHMRLLNKNKEFYHSQSRAAKGVSRMDSMKVFEKKKENRDKDKQKSTIQLEVEYPYISERVLAKEKIKGAYVINFNQPKKVQRSKSQSVIKFRGAKEINKILQKRRPSHQLPQMIPNNSSSVQFLQQPSEIKAPTMQRRQSFVSLMSSKISTQKVNKRKQSLVSQSDKKQQDVNLFLDSSKYMKSRFNVSFAVKYDYETKLKEKAENFKNQIMHHYVQDSEMPTNESI